MKFRVKFTDMKEALMALGKAAKKSSLGDSALIRLTLTSDTMVMEVNGDAGVIYEIPAWTDHNGEFVTSYDALKILTLRDCDGDIQGTIDEKTMLFKYKDGKVRNSFPRADTPFNEVARPSGNAVNVSIPLDKLREMFNDISFVCPKIPDSNLHSLKLSISDDTEGILKLELMACDGKSAARRRAYAVKKGAFTGETVVLPEMLKLSLDVLKGKDGDVDIAIEDGKVFISRSGIIICFPELETRFPDLTNIMAMRSGTTFSAEMNRDEFIEAMKCVLYLQSGASAMFQFSDNQTSIGCPGLTEYAENLDTEISGQIKVPVFFNAEMLKDIASCLPDEKIKMEGTSNKNPFFLSYGEQEEYIYCALPRVSR